MTDNKTYTYVLYITECLNPYDANDNETIYLGSCQDPIKLYKNGLTVKNIELGNRGIVLRWLNLVEKELNYQEKYDLDYAFMHNPEDEFSYPIKNITLYIKKVNHFD